MARSDERPKAYEFVAVFFALASALAACAEYDDKGPHLGATGGEGATVGGSGGFGADMAMAGDASDPGGSAAGGSSGAPVGGSSEGGTTSGGGTSGSGGSAAGKGGSAGSAMGGGGTGGKAGGGVGGTASGGMASGGTASGGMASGGMASGGMGGSAPVEVLLSKGRPATADSVELTHDIAFGNDGTTATRYCAVDSAVGHHWQVDLGQSYAITRLHILWEKSALYQFKIEGSQDNVAYSSILDESKTTSTSANQTYLLSNGVGARYVRVTATTLPNTTTWLSFFEFEVFGH